MLQFARKTIAVTGSASGIGRATCQHLASLGANLSMADVNRDAISSLHKELQSQYPSQKFLVHPINVRDRLAVQAWITQTVESLGPLDGAANLAGVMGSDAYKVATQDIDDKDWDFVMGVNLGGVLNCLREQIKTIKDGGAIVNASSLAGLLGVPQHAAYVCSKHAVIGLTRTAARELGPRNVRVNAIAPGPIETPLMDDAIDRIGKGVNETTCALGRAGKPQEVAKLVAHLLSDNSSYMTGTVQVIDGGIAC